MCGIAGIVRARARLVDDEATVARMTEDLRHRGPDGEGLLALDTAVLGHRRLSIIDLSDQGRQPMTNEDESIYMVFNGEIYNHLELYSHRTVIIVFQASKAPRKFHVFS